MFIRLKSSYDIDATTYILCSSIKQQTGKQGDQFLLCDTKLYMIMYNFVLHCKILGLIQPTYRSRHSYTIKATKATLIALVKFAIVGVFT